MRAYQDDFVQPPYFKKLTSLFKKDFKIYDGSDSFVPTYKMQWLLYSLLTLPIILFALFPFKIIPGTLYTVNLLLFILLLFVVMLLVSPLFIRYVPSCEKKPSFIKLFFTGGSWGAFLGVCAVQMVRYFDRPYYSGNQTYAEYIIELVLPVCGVLLVLNTVITVGRYIFKMKKYKEKT